MLAALLLVGGAATALRAQPADPGAPPLLRESPPEPGTNFSALGVATGTPGYLNLVGERFWTTVALQASAGYWSQGRWGLQGAAVWRTLHYPSFSVGPAALLGTFGTQISSDSTNGGSTHRRQVYIGPALDLYLDGVHLQTGIAYGFRDYPKNPQLVIQAGYLFRLR